MDNWQAQSNNGCNEMQLDKDNCQCVVAVRSASKNRRRLHNVGTATSSSSSRTDEQEHIVPSECQQSCEPYSDKCFEEQSHLSLPLVERDSGTESDEELELIETNSMTSVAVSQTSDYYASQPSWSISSCHSVVGSPVCCALNDQDLNCWDNLSIHCSSEQPPTDDANEQIMDPELPLHHYHTRQQFQRLKQQISIGATSPRRAADNANTNTNSSSSSSTGSNNEPTGIAGRRANFSVSDSSKTAFVCLKRSRERLEQESAKRGNDEQKKKESSDATWPNVHHATRRTAPIRLLIPPAAEETKLDLQETTSEEMPSNGSTSADMSPRKKSRHHNALKCSATSARPSLNFEKMQKKMVKPMHHHRKKGSSSSSLLSCGSSRDSMKAKVKLRVGPILRWRQAAPPMQIRSDHFVFVHWGAQAWSDGYQLRSCGNNYLFRPLESADDAFNQMEHDVDDDLTLRQLLSAIIKQVRRVDNLDVPQPESCFGRMDEDFWNTSTISCFSFDDQHAETARTIEELGNRLQSFDMGSSQSDETDASDLSSFQSPKAGEVGIDISAERSSQSSNVQSSGNFAERRPERKNTPEEYAKLQKEFNKAQSKLCTLEKQLYHDRYMTTSHEDTIRRIAQGEPYSFCSCRSAVEKVSLLEKAFEFGDGDAICCVLLFLEGTLAPSAFRQLLLEYSYAAKHYVFMLRQLEDTEKLIETLLLLGQQEELVNVELRKIKMQRDSEAKIRALRKAIGGAMFAGSFSEERRFLQEQLDLLERQLPVEDSDTKAIVQGQGEKFFRFPKSQSLVGLSVLETLEYCCLYHYDLPSNSFASPLSIRAQYKISDRQFGWIVAKALAAQHMWPELQKLMLAKNLFGKQKLKSPISCEQFLRLLSMHGAPSSEMVVYISSLTNGQRKLDLAKKYKCDNIVVEQLVALRDRAALLQYISGLTPNSESAQKAMDALDNPVTFFLV
ncbi:Vps16 C and Golgin A5 domain containing protein [Trichuris trichiura]|uniref:Vps16 C and Golgin A5 domain containing protein n=1 Tax=Trichuris trichiura TaxID=36087 RepID=A0A077Z7R5_TRITR|nr:Vps16 C and Golgin A5 domain containing protein [Trichuris trichiura]